MPLCPFFFFCKIGPFGLYHIKIDKPKTAKHNKVYYSSQNFLHVSAVVKIFIHYVHST